MKQYVKTDWKDRLVQFPNRYKDQNNNVITLTQDPGEVAQDGTMVEAKVMNNIEEGIEHLFENRSFGYTKTLLVANWTKNASTGYYEYDIIDENITAQTIVDGMLDIENQAKLNISYTESYLGGFKVITTELPNEEISITFKYSLLNSDDKNLVARGTINVSSKDTDNLNKVYGIRRSLTTSSSSWERIKDAVGLVAHAQVGTTPVRNDFDEIYPWSDIISYNYDTTARQVTAYYGDPTFKFDGSNGDVLTKIPEFYWRRYRDSNYEYILISKKKLAGFVKSEEFSVGRYTMSGSSSRVYSRSGYAPLTNVNITNFRNYARALGSGFGQMDWHYFILQMLYLVEYADYNSQSKLGKGYTNGSHTAPVNSGGCDRLGMKSGSVDGTDNTSMIYRGIEDIFGNVWQFIDGINIRNSQTYICYDANKYAVDTFSGSYKALGYTNAPTEGYASKLGYDSANPMVAITTEATGSTSTNMCDYFYRSADGDRIALVGGGYGHGLSAGLWLWSVTVASSSLNSYCGARLLKTS